MVAVVKEFYGTSPIKRHRRTKAEMEPFYQVLLDVVREQQPMTVRQAFYQAEVMGLVEKEETGYGEKDGARGWGRGCGGHRGLELFVGDHRRSLATWRSRGSCCSLIYAAYIADPFSVT